MVIQKLQNRERSDHRHAVVVATTANDGSYDDFTGDTGRAQYMYMYMYMYIWCVKLAPRPALMRC
jgi:hypothetical protein